MKKLQEHSPLSHQMIAFAWFFNDFDSLNNNHIIKYKNEMWVYIFIHQIDIITKFKLYLYIKY